MTPKSAIPVLLVLIVLNTLLSCKLDQNKKDETDYKISPVLFTDVQLQDNFWLPRILKNTEVTIPIAFSQSEETGRIKNFEVAGGMIAGSFCSIYPFDDSDVFKIMEGAAYSLMVKPDPELEGYLDSLIHKISLAQEPDGYLYTNRTILGDSAHEWAGQERWQHVHEHSHELYNVGHMYEAAVAHFQATGKTTFLDIAIKNANLVDKDFGWGKIENYPGHQEIEIGLVKLFRATGDKRYLDLAKFFLDVRGPDGWDYNQAHQKVTDQLKPVGHAVRALYMYSGMADVAALTGDQAYLTAIENIWNEVVTKKMYVTGGIGQSGGNEGFGPDYDLPNMSAYCETCASIANVFWNQRMFLLSGSSKYIDVMERTMYNALLSGVALSGDLFFYPNPLESDGQHHRKEWFGCACCPSNISRFLPSVPGYVYAFNENDIFVNLYIASQASFSTASGEVKLQMQGNYPWEGKMVINLNTKSSARHKIYLRIPGWARNEAVPGDLYFFTKENNEKITIKINGKESSYEMINGYALLDRKWENTDRIELNMPMPVRKLLAFDSVVQDKGRFALQKGPLMFCLEDKDQEEKMVRYILGDLKEEISIQEEKGLFNGIQSLNFEGSNVASDLSGQTTTEEKTRALKAIPYAYWANRGPGQMLVWVPFVEQFATPKPAPTIAYVSSKLSSGAKGDLKLLSDQYKPLNSNDHSIGYIHWWPQKDTSEWLIYEFEKPEKISQVKVYWFDDGPHGGCRVPKAWQLYFLSEGNWKPIIPVSPYTITKDDFDSIAFKELKTKAIKLKVDLQKEYSSGVHEWIIN